MIGAYRVIIALIISATVLAVTYMGAQVMVVESQVRAELVEANENRIKLVSCMAQVSLYERYYKDMK